MNTYSPVSVLTGHASGITEPRRIGCEHDATAATRGHSDSHGGLRGHSIGDSYPWRVVGYGDGSWAVESAKGETVARCRERPGDMDHDCASKRAHRLAQVFKILHPLGYVENTPAGLPANISGPLDEIPARLVGHTLIVNHEHGGGHRYHVLPFQDLNKQLSASGSYRTIKLENRDNGDVVAVSLPWLAYNQHLSIYLDH